MEQKRNILGVDIGAHKVAAVLWRGEVVSSRQEIYSDEIKQDFNEWFLWISNFLKSFVGSEEIDRVGVGAAGLVSDGTVLKSPNLQILDGQNLENKITDTFGKETILDNDARCFLRAESRLGAAKGLKNVVGITLGTGFGGAVLLGGNILEGAHESAGEMGRVVIEGDNTLEDLVSTRGFKRLSDKSVEELASLARKGDEGAKKVFKQVGRYLGRGLGNIVNTLDPEVIVLGGGIALVGELLFAPAREEMRKIIMSPQAKEVKLLKSHFKENAVAIGAALLF